MGYQALLFCPDEKLAALVSQVFTDLDFTVEVVHDPFGAVKRLMARHYDALVVDTENEQNAPLLIKSARNSTLNQGCLAIALVEGQMGVAKAYRIGANLVLTKPINVEQAKGTLRVARGLLRKNAEAAAAHAASATQTPLAAKSAPSFAANSTLADSKLADAMNELPVAPAATPSSSLEPLAFKASQSVAHSEPEPAEVLPAGIEANARLDDSSLTEIDEADVLDADVLEIDAPSGAQATAASSSPSPVSQATEPATQQRTNSTPKAPSLVPSTASAAAAAPAKEITDLPDNNPTKPEPQKESHADARNHQDSTADGYAAAYVPTFGSLGSSDAPSFGASDADDSEGSGGSKKFLFIAAAVLVVAAAGYFGYTKFAAPTAQSAAAPSFKAEPVPPTPAPAPAVAAPAPVAEQPLNPEPNTETNAPAAKTPPTQMAIEPLPTAQNPPVIHIAATPEPQPKKAEPAPLLVKSGSATSHPKTSTSTSTPDDASAPTLTADSASATPGNLSGLMTSAAPVPPKPTLATTKVSQGVSTGLLIKRVDPKYPPAALATHSWGTVEIDAKIDTQGYVKNLKVLKGDPILAQAALEAVRQWRYKPYYLDGAPVEIETQITINFKANQ